MLGSEAIGGVLNVVSGFKIWFEIRVSNQGYGFKHGLGFQVMV